MSSEWFYLQQWKYNRYLKEEAENKKPDEEKENEVSTAPPEN